MFHIHKHEIYFDDSDLTIEYIVDENDVSKAPVVIKEYDELSVELNNKQDVIQLAEGLLKIAELMSRDGL